MQKTSTRANLVLLVTMGFFMVMGIGSYRDSFFPNLDPFQRLDLSDIGWYRYAETFNPQESNLVLKFVDTPPSFKDSTLQFKRNAEFLTLLVSRRNNPASCFAHHGLVIESQGEARVQYAGKPYTVQTFILANGKSRFACVAWEFEDAPGARIVDHGVRSRFEQMAWNMAVSAVHGKKTISARVLIDMPQKSDTVTIDIDSQEGRRANIDSRKHILPEEIWKRLESQVMGIHKVLTGSLKFPGGKE